MLKVGDRVCGTTVQERSFGVIASIDDYPDWPVRVELNDGSFARYSFHEVFKVKRYRGNVCQN